MRYIISNFAYGYGPFLRVTELALALSEEIERAGGEKIGVIVPWVYGSRQKAIMREEFGAVINRYPDQILLDKKLGQVLGSIFYDQGGYESSLRRYLAGYRRLSQEAEAHFCGSLIAENFFKKKLVVNKKDVVLALTRAPRLSFSIEPSFNASFAFVSEVIERAADIRAIATDRQLLKAVAPICRNVESRLNYNFIAEPATFSYLKRKKPFFNETLTPPNALLPQPCLIRTEIKPGIYVTVTGIPGLDRLFKEARKIGLQIYTNQPTVISGSVKARPDILFSGRILLHFARSGWGSIWLSQFSGVPFVTPAFDKYDDPEIYFNNICIEKLGLGKIYCGEPLAKLLEYSKQYQSSAERMNSKLLAKFGTTDGVGYTAKEIAKQILKSKIKL